MENINIRSQTWSLSNLLYSVRIHLPFKVQFRLWCVCGIWEMWEDDGHLESIERNWRIVCIALFSTLWATRVHKIYSNQIVRRLIWTRKFVRNKYTEVICISKLHSPRAPPQDTVTGGCRCCFHFNIRTFLSTRMCAFMLKVTNIGTSHENMSFHYHVVIIYSFQCWVCANSEPSPLNAPTD